MIQVQGVLKIKTVSEIIAGCQLLKILSFGANIIWIFRGDSFHMYDLDWVGTSSKYLLFIFCEFMCA